LVIVNPSWTTVCHAVVRAETLGLAWSVPSRELGILLLGRSVHLIPCKERAGREHPGRPLYSSVHTIPTPHSYVTQGRQNVPQ
ncbi:MAG: hypothetical protein ACYTBS_12855, partial [Planctomycetota bacterium]